MAALLLHKRATAAAAIAMSVMSKQPHAVAALFCTHPLLHFTI
jgi:hypothetical protein